MEKFCLGALPEAELAAITDHLTKCQSCHELFANKLRDQRGSAHVNFPLEPKSLLRHDHVEFESLRKIADNELDAIDREMIDAHLTTCSACREDLASFLEFTKQLEPELRVRYGPTPAPRRDVILWWNWWRGLAWRPAYSAAVVMVAIAIVISAVLLIRRNQNLQTQQVPTPTASPGSMPASHTASVPSPSVVPTESPEPSKAEVVVTLNDRGGIISVDRAGNVTGLDDVPAATRDVIAKVFLSERIEPPAVLKELGGEDVTLRGSNTMQPFKLVSPSRSVIISTQPTLRWEKAIRATSYKVYVNDQNGNEVAKSEELSAESTSWILPKALKRGDVYTWTVVAVVDQKEIVSPGPSAPEMRFKVLSAGSLQALQQLKNARSHLAFGVFYAREGMVKEAERELQILARDNPRSRRLTNLLKEIQSWQSR
jgi:predicted anti-sigma-YlaC factor YlaD